MARQVLNERRRLHELVDLLFVSIIFMNRLRSNSRLKNDKVDFEN